MKIHPQTETGDLVEARWDGLLDQSVFQKGAGANNILLLAHMDTVFPLGTLGKMPFYEKEGKVFGPGVSDMKGGIVVALTAIAEVLEAESLTHPLVVLFTPDEEIGSGNSRAMIEKLAARVHPGIGTRTRNGRW